MAKRLAVVDVERCVDCLLCTQACARRFGEGGLARSAIAVRSAGGMEREFVVVVCRACTDPPPASTPAPWERSRKWRWGSGSGSSGAPGARRAWGRARLGPRSGMRKRESP